MTKIENSELQIFQDHQLTKYDDSKIKDDAELLKTWFMSRASKSVNTYEAYKRDIEQFANFVKKPFGSISLDDLQRFQFFLMKEKKYSNRTISRKINVVKSLFTHASKNGYIPFNLARQLNTPPIKETPRDRSKRIISQENLDKVFSLAEDDYLPYCVLLKFMYASKARVSELLKVKKSDLHLSEDKTFGVVILDGKGNKEREVKIDLDTYQSTIQLGHVVDSEFIFSKDRNGKHLDRFKIHRIVKHYVKQAGLPPQVSSHWLRHSSASHSLAEGAPISYVKDDLGHENLSTTSLYVHKEPNKGSVDYLPLLKKKKDLE